MFAVLGNSNRLTNKNLSYRLMSSCVFLSKKPFKTDGNNITFRYPSSKPVNLCETYNEKYLRIKSNFFSLSEKRYFSKKKDSKKRNEEEDSDSEEEYDETAHEEVTGDGVITKTVSSLRVDSILKVGLGVTKKKIEQDYYALKLRRNGEKVIKKAQSVSAGDEIDRVRGFSPDTSKFLIVDRVVVKGFDKMTGTGMYPVKMEVLKSLTIENYEDPWRPDSVAEMEK